MFRVPRCWLETDQRGRTFSGATLTRYFLARVLVRRSCSIIAQQTYSYSPSRTDTLGLVMLEANACGVPVAALPVPGPLDVIGDSGAGVLHDDLGFAIAEASAHRRPNLPA